MRDIQVLTTVFLLTAASVAHAADTVSSSSQNDFAASLLLRGGYDTNPEFSSGNGIGGSALVGTETALAAGRKTGNATIGVAAGAAPTPRACAAR